MSEKVSLIDGFNHALENSISLNKIAIKSASEGGFGVGCSLNILSAEEAIKAVACFAKHYLPAEAEDFDQIFKSHTVKHESIKALIQLVKNINTIGLSESKEEYYNMILDAYRLMKEEPKLSKVEIEEKFPTLTYFRILYEANEARILVEVNTIIKGIKEIRQNLDDIIEWLSTANLEKNNGFYVGLENGKWLLPSSFSEQKFQIENRYTETIIECVKQLKPLFLLYVVESPFFHPEVKSTDKALAALLV